MEDGRSVPCSDLVLSPGDFVDVGVVFDIAFTRTTTGYRKLKVHLGIGHVLRIMSKTQVEKVRITILVIVRSCLDMVQVLGLKHRGGYVDNASTETSPEKPRMRLHASTLKFDNEPQSTDEGNGGMES